MLTKTKFAQCKKFLGGTLLSGPARLSVARGG